jgi:tetratricopeptide (TPR) repeat protein
MRHPETEPGIFFYPNCDDGCARCDELKIVALNQPEMVGRWEELADLKAKLDAVLLNTGSMVLIAGEAGIGKTRLVTELMNQGEDKFQILKGWCLAENLEPLMPIQEMLRSANLQYLVSGLPPPKAISAYLINEAGLLIAKAEREDSGLDPDIFASMLKAVGDFVKDSLAMLGKGGNDSLNAIGYGKYRIMLQSLGKMSIGVVVEGNESELLIDDMKTVLASIGDGLDNWSGQSSEAAGFATKVAWFIDSGKYDGTFLVDDPKLKQENLFENVLLGIQRASAEKPTLLFLDDLQWADPTTLNLLHYLARNTRKNRVFILGTYRPEDILQSLEGKTHQLETAMQNMSREDLFHRIEMTRLGSEETEKVMQSVLGATSFEKGFFEKVHRETGGTPFFILETVKLLVEEGAIAHDEKGTWKLAKELEKLDLPTKVYDVLKRRLDRLQKEQLEMLECASVIGEEFSTDVLGKTTETKKITLLKNLGEIEKAHKLIHYLKDKYKFDHAKIREVLYSGIGDELKREYHRMVGDAIAELRAGDAESAVAELAYHYHEAGDLRAWKYLIRAGDRARERYANEEAITLYGKALATLKDKGGRIAVLEALGDLHALIGDYVKAIGYFLDAKDDARDDEAKARMLRKAGDSYEMTGEFDKSLEMLSTARMLFNDETKAEYGRMLVSEGYAHYRKGNTDEARPLFFKAVRLFEQTGVDQKGLGNALRAVGNSHYCKGEYDSALTYYEKSLAVMERANEQIGIADALSNICTMYYIKGMLDKALEFQERSLNIEGTVGYKRGVALSLNNLGNVYIAMGRLERSVPFHERSQEMFDKIGDKLGYIHSSSDLASVNLELNNVQRALKDAEKAVGISVAIGAKSEEGMSRRVLGMVYREMKEFAKASKEFEKAALLTCEIGDKSEMASLLFEHGVLNSAMGDDAKAREYLDTALSEFQRMGTKQWVDKCKNALNKLN